MKGVAIAIETVIYIILAVLVLTILLFFFTSQSGPAQQQINLQRERNEICSAIAAKDPKCEDITAIGRAVGADKLTKLRTGCNTLSLCSQSDTESVCIKKCCIFCPKPVTSP